MASGVGGWRNVTYQERGKNLEFLVEGEEAEERTAQFAGQLYESTDESTTGMLFPAAPSSGVERVRGVALGITGFIYGKLAFFGNLCKASDRTIDSLLPHERTVGLAGAGFVATVTLLDCCFNGMNLMSLKGLIKTPFMVLSSAYVVTSLWRMAQNKDVYSTTAASLTPQSSSLTKRVTAGWDEMKDAFRAFGSGIGMLFVGGYSVFSPKESLRHFHSMENRRRRKEGRFITYKDAWGKNTPQATFSGKNTFSVASIFNMHCVGNVSEKVSSGGITLDRFEIL